MTDRECLLEILRRLPYLGCSPNSTPYHELVLLVRDQVDPYEPTEPKQIMDTNAR